MKARFSLVLSITLVVAFLLTACGPTATAVVQPTEAVVATAAPTAVPTVAPTATATPPVTLNFNCWEGDLGTHDDVVANLITPFTKATGINVNYEVAPWGDYWTKFNTLAATKSLPDIFCESVAYTWDHAASGLLADLTPLQKQMGDNYFWTATNNLGIRYPQVDSDIYAMPFRIAGEVIFYNKDIFDAAGVPYPTNDWTYADMIAIAKKLTKVGPDGKTSIYGLYMDGWYQTYDTYVKANGGLIVDPAQTKCLANSTIGIQALQDEVNWIYDLKIAPVPGSLNFQGAYPFGSGKFGMFADITPAFNYLTNAPFRWGIVLPPEGTVGRKIYGGPDPIAISANSAHSKEAMQFLQYIESAEVQSNPKITGAGSIPFNKTVAYSDNFLNGRGYPANLKVLLDNLGAIADADFGSHWIEWRATAMNNEIQAALLKKETPTVALNNACTAIDKILSNK
jgi:multiple sugar transport system substrate-binding protein